MYSNRRAHKEGVRGQLNRSRNDPATILSRPELRFDHSRDPPGYNNDTAATSSSSEETSSTNSDYGFSQNRRKV